MIGVAIIALLFLYVIVHFYKDAYKKPVPNFPPGPPSLPLYGAYWILLAKDIFDIGAAVKKLAVEYKTKVVGMYLGSFPSIIIDDPALIKEVLQREEFDGRVDVIIGRLRSYWKRLGIFFTDDYFWHVQRRFSLRYMRDYGFGKRHEDLEMVVSNEVKEMIDMVLQGPKYPAEQQVVKNNLVCLPDIFVVPFINGLLHVLARMTAPRSDYNVLWDMARQAVIFQKSSNDVGGALTLTPWLKDIMPQYSGYRGLVSGSKAVRDFCAKFVKDALEIHDESHDRHFLDVYIKKMKEEMKNNDRTTFSVDQLVLICVDYVFPSITSVQAVLSILIERILVQPEIQDKVHEEIDRVVGRDRQPNLDDRRNMPYTESCIREAMRFETPVPLGVPHRTMKDTQLGGYDIPQDTFVAFNFSTLNNDKTLWGDPENFRPERYIVDGQLQVNKDKSLPFGAGRRLCAGETFARQTMFQVFAGFMQAFRVSTVDGSPLTKSPVRKHQGLITIMPTTWVRATPRP